ncbi:MAG TPA: NHL repeat-containing protein [Candidatus Baltobacteraceae bacterium]|jgi:sugar lactone lactonase YvrE|nr:NHL repeat-containing protein [Candidatus Baltobacteraceae bacterium]
MRAAFFAFSSLALAATALSGCGHGSLIGGAPATTASQALRAPLSDAGYATVPQYYAVPLPSGFTPYAITHDGQIPGAIGNQAAIYKNGTLKLLASDLNCKSGTTTATAVNTLGQAVGYCRTVHNTFAALYFVNGTVQQLPRPKGTLQEWGFTQAWAINDAGLIYGAANDMFSSSGPYLTQYFTNGQPAHVFHRDMGMAQNVFLSATGHFAYTNFIYLSGSYAAVGFGSNLMHIFEHVNNAIAGINDRDVAVGYDNNQAFLYSAAAGTTFISLPSGIVSMTPTGINNAGQVIGQACTLKRCLETFLYSSGNVIDVSAQISPKNSYRLIPGLADNGNFVAADPQGNYDIIQPAKPLFVGNWIANTVTAYAPPYTVPLSTTSYFLSYPEGLAFDGKGNLFVANSGADDILEFAPPYTGEPIASIKRQVYAPRGLAFGPSGNLFVASGDSVRIYPPPYTGGPIGRIVNGVRHPSAVAFDSKGNLFVANLGGSTVTEYAPPYTGAPIVRISNPLGYPRSLVLDAHDDLFVGNDTRLQNFNAVLEYAPPYTGSPIATITNGVSGPYGLAMDAGGNLFVANFTSPTSDVTAYAPPYTGAPIVIITNGVRDPWGLAFAP